MPPTTATASVKREGEPQGFDGLLPPTPPPRPPEPKGIYVVARGPVGLADKTKEHEGPVGAGRHPQGNQRRVKVDVFLTRKKPETDGPTKIRPGTSGCECPLNWRQAFASWGRGLGVSPLPR